MNEQNLITQEQETALVQNGGSYCPAKMDVADVAKTVFKPEIINGTNGKDLITALKQVAIAALVTNAFKAFVKEIPNIIKNLPVHA